MTRQQLVEDNMKLVYYIVSREYPTYLHDEDIIQSGMFGLCKAAENWDETKSKFSTYAGRCIRNAINQEFINRKPYGKLTSLDANIGEDTTLGDMLVGEADVGYIDDGFIRSLSAEERMILNYDNEGYSTDEIADLVNCNVEKVRKVLRIIRLKWKKYEGV